MGKIKLSVLLLGVIMLAPQLFARKSIIKENDQQTRAGVCKINITPPLTVPLGGYANRTGTATGVRDSLYAAVIVFDDGKNRAVIVTLDVIQVKYREGQAIFRAIENKTGLSQDREFINASHTHGSPWLESDSVYSETVAKKIASAVQSAMENMMHVQISYGEGSVSFNVNRRIIMTDGKSIIGLNPEGLTDQRVKILRIDNPKEPLLPLAVIFHSVCHPNVFRWQNTLITADFPGVAKSFIERAMFSRTSALFLQGCSGNIRANLPEKGKSYGDFSFGRNGDEADLLWCGGSIGAEVVKILTWLGVREQKEKRSPQVTLDVIADSITVSAKIKENKGIVWPREKIVDGKVLFPVKIIKIGDCYIIGLPGEPVVEYGIRIEERLKKIGMEQIIVTGYMEGDLGYIPVAKMFEEGGYEVNESALLPECENEIMQGVEKIARKLMDRGKNH